MSEAKSLPNLYISVVYAGFPGTADDMIETPLDLNEYVVKHPSATYFVRVVGESMKGVGIMPSDILVVDRSISPSRGDVVIAAVNGEFAVKRYLPEQGRVVLRSENPKFRDMIIEGNDEFQIWGVVTHSLHHLR